MNPRHAAELALVGWYLMMPQQGIDRWNRGTSVVQIEQTPVPESDEMRGDEVAKLEAVIARYKDRLGKIPHVVGVEPTYDDNGNYIIAIMVDVESNVADVERAEPSQLDGYPVVVFPPSQGILLRRASEKPKAR